MVNIHIRSILCQQSRLGATSRKLANVKQKYKIYCNCRNNNLSQLLQFNDYRIETIDFAKLAIDQLKNNPKSLLTDLVEFDDTGCCCTPFRSLVIGMNEIGEEAFNYLYEFGAFANRQKKRSDFECHVISIIKRALAKHTQRQYTMQDLYDVLPESLTQDIKADHICDDKYLNTLIENLAVLEHLRWVASHELMGFQYEANVEKRLRSLLKKHSGMVDWNKLTNDIKLFDVAVVITSLMIEKDEQR